MPASRSFLTLLTYTCFPDPEDKHPFINVHSVHGTVFRRFLCKFCIIFHVLEVASKVKPPRWRVSGHVHLSCWLYGRLCLKKRSKNTVEDRVLGNCCAHILFSLNQTSEPVLSTIRSQYSLELRLS